MDELLEMCPENNVNIGTEVSKPLAEAIANNLPESITMPSRLENKVLFDSIVMNPNVKMVFFNPTMHTNIGKLFNGSLLALFDGSLPRNEELLTTMKIPITVITKLDTTHVEEELPLAITSALS
jgi:hypothetical protein